MEGAGYRQSSQFRQFYPSPDSAAVTAAAALHGYHSKWDLLRFQQVYGGSASGGKSSLAWVVCVLVDWVQFFTGIC